MNRSLTIIICSLFILAMAGCTSSETVPVPDEGDAGVNAADDSSDQETGEPDSGDNLTEADLEVCDPADSCIIVAYDHCCGAAKRAINAAHEDAYASHTEWQSYHEQDCAVIGACRDDSQVTEAECNPDGRCVMVFP